MDNNWKVIYKDRKGTQCEYQSPLNYHVARALAKKRNKSDKDYIYIAVRI
jgi:hypothetical protein